MAGYSGVPPPGGQYNNTHYGAPYQQNPPSFNNIIPALPHPYNQQQAPFPPNYPLIAGQAPYLNHLAYQTNSRYAPQQFPHPPHLSMPAPPPPLPPPPFPVNYGGYGNNTTYGNGYPQAGEMRDDRHFQSQKQTQQDQPAQEYTLAESNLGIQQPPISKNYEPSMSHGSLETTKAGKNLSQLQIPTQFNASDQRITAQISQDGLEDNVDASSGKGSSADQTPMQLDSATTNHSEPILRAHSRLVQHSQSSSEASFDPYSQPAFQSLDGVNSDNKLTVQPAQQVANEVQVVKGNPVTQPAQTQLVNNLGNIHQERKVLAIQAVQDLASRKIGYDQISREDIDMDLLKQLYLESGVPMELPTMPKAPLPLSTNSQPTSLQAAPLVSEGITKKSISFPVDPPAITAVPNFNLPLPAVVKSSVSSTKAPQPSGPKTVLQSAKESSAASAPIVVPSRQDYLAKLQAAKAAVSSKASPVSTTPPAQDRSSYLARLQAAKEAVKQNATSKSTETTQSRQDGKLTNAVGDVALTKANIDALIRQKLEALKKTQSINSTQVPQEIATDITTPMAAGALDQEQRPASSGQPSAVAKLRAPIRTFSADQVRNEEVSFFSPMMRRSFVGGIPGLPGIADSFATPTGQEVQFFDSTINDKTGEIVSRDLLENTPVDRPSAVNIQHQLELANSTPIRQPSPETQPSRKRAVAADFIDPLPTKHHQTGSSGPISLVIDVSEEEDEQGETVDDLIRNASTNEGRGTADFSLSSMASTRSNSHNPPNAATPDLQAKEDAIRELRQRILAATLRKTGKSMPGSSYASQPESPLPLNSEQVKNIENAEQQQAALKESTLEISAQEKALAAAKLQAQRHLEQIRRNQASLSNHAQRVQHDLRQSNSSVKRELSMKRKLELEARLTTLQDLITTTEADLSTIQREQDKLVRRMQEENAERTSLMEELKELVQNLDKEADLDKALQISQSTALNDLSVESEPTPIQSMVSDFPVSTVKPVSDRHISDPAGLSSDQPVQILSSGSNSADDRSSSSGEIHESESSDDDEMQIDDDNDDDDGIAEEYDPEVIEFPITQETLGKLSEPLENLESAVKPNTSVQDVNVVPSSSRSVSAEGHPTSYQQSDRSLVVDLESEAKASEDNESQSQSARDTSSDSNNDEGLLDSAESPAMGSSAFSTEVESVSHASSRSDSDNDIASELERQLIGDESQIMEVLDHQNMPDHSVENKAVEDDLSTTHQHFIPYESALRQFGSYRFHPDYKTAVGDGFRSLTFNHNINPQVEMCRWELAGGTCSDTGCQYQHFKDIVLTDNNLLLQLGSVTEGRTLDEKERYISGLRETINGMRSRGLKDVDSIAAEIVAYRRSFLEDPSRVIANLNVS